MGFEINKDSEYQEDKTRKNEFRFEFLHYTGKKRIVSGFKSIIIFSNLSAMMRCLKYTLSFERNKVYLPFSRIAPPEGIKQVVIAAGTHV